MSGCTAAAPATSSGSAIRVFDWIEHQAGIRPDRLALAEEPSGRQFTYARFHERVARVAACLTRRGAEPGDRVGFPAMDSTDNIAEELPRTPSGKVMKFQLRQELAKRNG